MHRHGNPLPRQARLPRGEPHPAQIWRRSNVDRDKPHRPLWSPAPSPSFQLTTQRAGQPSRFWRTRLQEHTENPSIRRQPPYPSHTEMIKSRLWTDAKAPLPLGMWSAGLTPKLLYLSVCAQLAKAPLLLGMWSAGRGSQR